MFRRSHRGFDASLVPSQAFGAKALAQKRRDRYEDPAECPGFEYDRVYGFMSLCAVCKFPKRLHPKDASFMFEVAKSPERSTGAPRWVPSGNGYVRSDGHSGRRSKRLSERISRRLSDAIGGGRRRASSAGDARVDEVVPVPLDSLSEGDEDESTSAAEDSDEEAKEAERRASRRSSAARRSKDRPAERDDDDDENTEDENDDDENGNDAASRRLSSASSKRLSKRLSSGGKRLSAASKRSSTMSKRSSRNKPADSDDDTDGDDDDENAAPVAARRVSSASSKRSSRRSSGARSSSSKAADRDDDGDANTGDEAEEGDRKLSKRLSRASSKRLSRASSSGQRRSQRSAGNNDDDANTGDEDEDAAEAKGGRTSKRGSLASRISQRVSAAVRRSAQRLSAISEGRESAAARDDDDNDNVNMAKDLAWMASHFDDDAGVQRASGKRDSKLSRGSSKHGSQRSSRHGSQRSSRHGSQRSSNRSSRSRRSGGGAAAGAASSTEEESAPEDFEEEDYDAYVGKRCRALFEDTKEFHEGEVLSHEGRGSFTIRFKNGTMQYDTDWRDVQVMDEEHDLVAPAEGRVDYDPDIDSLFEACERKDAIALQVLLQQGHDPDERNGMRETPLVLAARVGDVACAKMLLQFGASDEDGAALAAAEDERMRKLVTEFGFGKTSKTARLTRDASGKLDVVRKHLSESAVSARRGRGASGNSDGSGARSAAGQQRGASWPLGTRDNESRASSMRRLKRSSSGLKKVLCFAGQGRHSATDI